MKLLITYDENYADEFDVSGFRIMESDKWEAYVQKVKHLKHWPQSEYFGTNEGIEWDCAEDHLRGFSIKKITNDDAKTITKLLGDSFGEFLTFDFDCPEELSEPRSLW